MRFLIRKPIRILALFFFAGFVFFLWVRFIEPSVVKVEQVFIEIENFPEKDLKLVHLTDIHSFGYNEKERRVVQEIKKIDPDFIFITGDMVDWRTEAIEECALFWEDIVSGKENRVFAVWGNHEHQNLHFKQIQTTVVESGIDVLVNERRRVEWGDSYFYLAGVDDPRWGHDDGEKAMGGLDKETPIILLAHSPEILRRVKHYQPDLILAGHTHGCQINIPVVCDWFIPLAYDKHYRQGLFEKDGIKMYVSRGIGETILPIRLNSLPEITVINIVSHD